MPQKNKWGLIFDYMIFTLDDRDNVFLDVIKSRWSLTYDQLFSQINASFEGFLADLSKLKINYADLKIGYNTKFYKT